jgi:hypothetical protein
MRISERSCSSIEEINSAVDSCQFEEGFMFSTAFIRSNALGVNEDIEKSKEPNLQSSQTWIRNICRRLVINRNIFQNLIDTHPIVFQLFFRLSYIALFAPPKGHYRPQRVAVLKSNLYKPRPLPWPDGGPLKNIAHQFLCQMLRPDPFLFSKVRPPKPFVFSF